MIRSITDNHHNINFFIKQYIYNANPLNLNKLCSAVNNSLNVITFSENFKVSRMKRLIVNEFIFP